MKYQPTEPFWRAYAKLPGHVKERARRAFRLFQEGAEDPLRTLWAPDEPEERLDTGAVAAEAGEGLQAAQRFLVGLQAVAEVDLVEPVSPVRRPTRAGDQGRCIGPDGANAGRIPVDDGRSTARSLWARAVGALARL